MIFTKFACIVKKVLVRTVSKTTDIH